MTIAIWSFFDMNSVSGYYRLFNFRKSSNPTGHIFFRSNNGATMDMYYVNIDNSVKRCLTGTTIVVRTW